MTRMEDCQVLRATVEPHYNCCQSILVPFAKEMGMTEAQAYALGAHFGSGMRHGSTCGAVTGALMALGLLGCGAEESNAFLKAFREQEGDLTCANLLAIGKEKDLEKKPHCTQLVAAAAALVDELSRT